MKEKRNRKLRINYGGKIQLQKLLFLIPIVIIILVFIMYREAGAYRAEEKLYTYMGEVQTEYPEGTKFQRTDDATYLKNAGGQSISSRPLYMGSDDKMLLPVPYAWVQMNVGNAAMYRLETFSTADISTGSVVLKDQKDVREGAGGFLFDGEGTYIFLEPAEIDWEDDSIEVPAMSFAVVQYGQPLNLHVYGEDSARLISINEKEVKASFKNGGSVNLGTNKLWLPNGTWLLLFTKPELLPRINEMK